MKKTLKFFASFMMMLSIAQNGWCDEYKWWANIGSNPIIRDVRDDTSLICSNDGGFYMFTLMTESSTNTTRLATNLDSISDFEIMNDTVFFCGSRYSNYGRIAVMGFFPLSTFPYCTISYFEMPWIVHHKKMDVGRCASDRHVIMIGINSTGENMIIDAIDLTTYWEIAYGVVNDSAITMSDVAITDHYVMFTSLNKINFIQYNGVLWMFKKPGLSGETILSQSIWTQKVSYTLTEPYLIDYCEEDYTVTASVDGTVHGCCTLIVSGYYKLQNISTVKIKEKDTQRSTLKDVKYTPNKQRTDVITYNSPSLIFNTWFNAIYSLNKYMMYSPGQIYAHVYRDKMLTSLTAKPNDPFHFITAGGNNPHIIKYKCNSWGSCMEKRTDSTIIDFHEHKPEPYNHFRWEYVNQIPSTTSGGEKEGVINMFCFSTSKDEEEEDDK